LKLIVNTNFLLQQQADSLGCNFSPNSPTPAMSQTVLAYLRFRRILLTIVTTNFNTIQKFNLLSSR